MFKIESPRCLVAPWQGTPQEREAFRRWTTDPEMMRYITASSWTDEDRENYFARQQASLAAAGTCFGAVTFKETGEIIGMAGAQPLELTGDWHLGWWVDRNWQGKGLASELAKGAADFVLNIVGRPRAVAVITPENLASRRVAEKAGMTYAETVRANTLETRWQDEDVVLYALERQS